MTETLNGFKTGLMALLDTQGQAQWSRDVTSITLENPSQFIRTFALASRRYPKSHLTSTDANRFTIPDHWRILDLVRVVFLLYAEQVLDKEFISLPQKLLITTDAEERWAVNYSLPYLKGSDALHDIATESLRTNIKSVFESLAHFNPYT